MQDKIERLIEKYMRSLNASKVSLSTLSSEELWSRSGRLDHSRSSEFLAVQDRKGVKYLLSPTHEEEITSLVAKSLNSYKELPLRLYQIGRKYRDELRPRQGLLRSREFVMKDLYTFDATEEAARRTYEAVCTAYAAFFDELGLPYLIAAASSGNMGGNLSHEYHFPSSHGEDTIISCSSCDYSLNEELYIRHFGQHQSEHPLTSVTDVECFASKDRKTLFRVHYPRDSGHVNLNAVKIAFPEVDLTVHANSAARAVDLGSSATSTARLSSVNIVDPRLPVDYVSSLQDASFSGVASDASGRPILLTKARSGDSCPNCNNGRLLLQQAVEIGHTFHLGTRYSRLLGAQVTDANNEIAPLEMGCHGIGVSRLIGAVGSLLADSKGLNWPLAIAPFEVLVVPGSAEHHEEAENISRDLIQAMACDIALDDRDRSLGWKLNDADLVGYPFVVVLGRAWRQHGLVELQCRRLQVKEELSVQTLTETLNKLKKQLSP